MGVKFANFGSPFVCFVFQICKFGLCIFAHLSSFYLILNNKKKCCSNLQICDFHVSERVTRWEPGFLKFEYAIVRFRAVLGVEDAQEHKQFQVPKLAKSDEKN